MVISSATIPVPTFNEYVRMPEAQRELFYLREEDRFALDVDALSAAATRNASEYIVLCNPNNPVGNVVSREDVERLLSEGFKVIVDEAFIDFSREHSVESLVEGYENLILITTSTKTMGIAGLRLGYLLTRNREVLAKLREVIPIWNVNALAERFIELCSRGIGEQYEDSLARTAAGSRPDVRAALSEISYLEPWPSHANFRLLPDQSEARAEIAEHLYENHKMLVKDGLNQQELRSDAHIRIGLKGPQDNAAILSALRELEGANRVIT